MRRQTRSAVPGEELRLGERCAVCSDVVVGFAKAVAFRLAGAAKPVLLPPVGAVRLPAGALVPVVAGVDRAVAIALLGRPGRCFFRAYTLAWVLRQRGVPVVMNVGWGLAGGRSHAHCWLTLDGQPFAERNDPTERFPIPLGRFSAGVCHWLEPEAPHVPGPQRRLLETLSAAGRRVRS